MDGQPFFGGRGMIKERGKEDKTGDLRGEAVFPTDLGVHPCLSLTNSVTFVGFD